MLILNYVMTAVSLTSFIAVSKFSSSSILIHKKIYYFHLARHSFSLFIKKFVFPVIFAIHTNDYIFHCSCDSCSLFIQMIISPSFSQFIQSIHENNCNFHLALHSRRFKNYRSIFTAVLSATSIICVKEF